MAYNKTVLSETAGGSIDRYAAVKISSGKVVETSADGDEVYGIAEHSAETDEKVDIRVEGTGKTLVNASTNISKGDNLSPEDSAGGKLVKYAASGDAHTAVALEAADSDGDVIITRLKGNREVSS